MPLIPSRRITWQVVAGVIDGLDSDQEPDIIPAIGEVFFDFSIPYVTVPDASPNPVTMLTMTFRGVFDNEGYLCTPDPVNPGVPGYRGVRIYVNDDPGLATTGWTVTVRPKFQVVNGSTPSIPAFAIAVVHGTEDLDLTRVVKVPSSPGVGVPEALALVERAEAAATAAASVRADADAGMFDGLDGDMTPAGPLTTWTLPVSALPSTLTANLTSNQTLVLPTPPADRSGTISLVIRQDATGGRTITWPSSVKWSYGVAPVLTATAGGMDLVHLFWTGTQWLGLVGGQSFA